MVVVLPVFREHLTFAFNLMFFTFSLFKYRSCLSQKILSEQINPLTKETRIKKGE